MLLFCVKTVVKACNFEQARLKKKEYHFGCLATFWFGTFVPMVVLFVLKMNGTLL